MKQFARSEKHIVSLFNPGEEFNFEGSMYEVILSGKPTTKRGEPKTDIYVRSRQLQNGNEIEFKISFKQENADFLENKMTPERAEQIFGERWQEIICSFTTQIKNCFLSRPFIYKSKFRRTQAGSITLGWRFELLNKRGGDLSDIVRLSNEAVLEVYAGKKLDDKKRNATVNGLKIQESGVANYIVNCNIENLHTTQEVVNHLIPIEDFAMCNPNVYFACKALNYRTFDKKFEGSRALSVYIDWQVKDGKLHPDVIFDNPLIIRGKEVAEKLIKNLDYLKIADTEDINSSNVSSLNHIHF
ncbi:hypothetical protein NJE56_05275 [Bacillus pumilus]|uniref:hypothetical protein n=1 Tax=Bacillus pumilus TaxID=1408 RepID=UPI0029C184EA|nr:hypothetical protein [Bacillus pumilus]MDX5484355.1 hypothetical protein [Bacillus pumilus]